jgi:cobalt-precorrin 5A hydrolase
MTEKDDKDTAGESKKEGRPIYAVYALTLPGLRVAESVSKGLGADLFATDRLISKTEIPSQGFSSLCGKLKETFPLYEGHIIVAATGLVVRAIAPHIKDKKTDPAVVTLGQDGKFVISLLSGHLGGGNELAKKTALITGGTPVVNTATDIAHKPAMEVVARDLGLIIEDFGALAPVSRELSEGSKVPLWDPGAWLSPRLLPWEEDFPILTKVEDFPGGSGGSPPLPFIYVDYKVRELPPYALVIRPPALSIGMGCHKGVDYETLRSLVDQVFYEEGFSPLSIAVVATAEIRGGEAAINELAKKLGRPLAVKSMDALSAVETPNPSQTVYNRIGVFSVCEAAAVLAAKMGPILTPKRKNPKATLAVALMNSSS